MPHLRHAVALRQRLDHVDMLASAPLLLPSTLRGTPFCCWIRTPTCCTPIPRRTSCYARLDGLSSVRGTLQGATAAATGQLQAALAAAGGAGDVLSARAAALRLPRRDIRRALAALIMPFRIETHWSLHLQPESYCASLIPTRPRFRPGDKWRIVLA